MSFENYEAQDVKPGKLVKVALNQLTGAPLLHVEHAGETNRGYWNEMLADTRGEAELGDRDYDAAAVADSIRRLKGRYARHVVRDLERVFHTDGAPATKADIPAFIEAMPKHAFLELVAFCKNPVNFVDVDTIPSARPEAVAAK